MKDTPINSEIVSQKIKESNLENVGKATIREIKKLIDEIEKATGEKFIRWKWVYQVYHLQKLELKQK